MSKGNKFNPGVRFPQIINPEFIIGVLDANTHPNILAPRQPPMNFKKPLGPFRQNLKRVPGRSIHHRKNLSDKFLAYLRMKQVTH